MASEPLAQPVDVQAVAGRELDPAGGKRGDGPPALAGVTGTAELKNLRVRRFGEDVAVEGDL